MRAAATVGADRRQQVVIVLGMHRSGTSCLAGLLQQAGVVLGTVIEQAPHNAKGNREQPAIVALNDAVLARQGNAWDCPGDVVSWDRELRARRDAMIASFDACPCWGFKDPRTLLTLPFWLDGLHGREVRCIGSLRHPAAVIASLRARQPDLPPALGLRLWLAYNRRLARWLAARQFPLVDFDLEPLAYRQAVAKAIAALGLTGGDSAPIATAGTTFFEPALRHQAADEDCLAGLDAGLAVDAKALHQRLRAAAMAPLDSTARADPEAKRAPFDVAPCTAPGLGADTRPWLTVIVIFHEMQREIRRTLHALTPAYQTGMRADEYEVLVIDSGSRQPLNGELTREFGDNFRVVRLEPRHPSPCQAMNRGAALARGELLLCLIDGARMLSPGVLSGVRSAFARHVNPFVYTLSMHLGPQAQNLSIAEGYDQAEEDRLLLASGWECDGYRLFAIASVALSSGDGFYARLSESNAFALRRDTYQALGGYDEGFVSPGGGLANLDFFNRALEADVQPILLLGEASFHQIHGGVATNVPLAAHPWEQFVEEYRRLRGKDYATVIREPLYLGEVRQQCAHLARRSAHHHQT